MVRVWNVAIRVTLQILESYLSEVRIVAFSPDSRQLAFSSDDKMVRVWDAATGAMLQILKANTVVTMLLYSSDGSIVVDRGQLDVISLYNNVILSFISSSLLSRSVAFWPRI